MLKVKLNSALCFLALFIISGWPDKAMCVLLLGLISLLGGHVGIVFICRETKVDLRGRVILIIHRLRVHIEVP